MQKKKFATPDIRLSSTSCKFVAFIYQKKHPMQTTTIGGFLITGISTRTTNENGAAATAIPQLWQRFIAENLAAQISGKNNADVYCVYTDYEKDHTRPYTVILGCRVDAAAAIPPGLQQVRIQEGSYRVFTAQGDLTAGAVFGAWTKIWNTVLPRLYRTDFEVYGAKAQNPLNGEVDIFVGIDE
jgi:predicted transcriptional regulator YdeE